MLGALVSECTKLSEKVDGTVRTIYIDGQNFLHRSRAGFGGENSIVFNFFRSLRALVETLKATRVVFVLDGHPTSRYEISPEYKANRVIAENKRSEMEEFYRQADLCKKMLIENFPIHVVKQPELECDDVVYNLVAASSRAVPITVVSTDSDFIQLLNEFENVSLYNPVKKCYVDNTDYDYVIWKSLRGDACDNVKKLKGFSDSVAEMYCRDIPRLKLFFESNKELSDQFAKNYSLIKFKTWSDEEAKKMFSSEPVRDWEKVKNVFEQMNFASMTNSKYWNRFVETFDKLWTTE